MTTMKTMVQPTILQSPVEKIAFKLQSAHQLKISHAVLRKTEAACRWLRSQQSLGAFGKNDNEWTRAAAMLECVLREETSQKIPEQLLASASFKDVRKFRPVHDRIVMVRREQKSQVAKKKTKALDASKSKRSSASATSSSTRSSARRKKLTTVFSDPAPLAALAGKLTVSVLVGDVEAHMARARRLLEGLLRQADHMDAAVARAYLHDLYKYQSAYEAACLYLAAMKRNKDGEGALTVQHIMMASNDFSEREFKHCLKYVEKTLGDQISRLQAPAVKSKKRTLSSTPRQPSSKRSRQSLIDEIEASVPFEASLPNVDTRPVERHVSATFLAWRNRIIQEAISTEKGLDPGLSEREARSCAADRVLAGIGITISRQ